jgi:hypothetical protein
VLAGRVDFDVICAVDKGGREGDGVVGFGAQEAGLWDEGDVDEGARGGEGSYGRRGLDGDLEGRWSVRLRGPQGGRR